MARLEPSLHAFFTVTPERALEDARRAEAAILAGEPGGPLRGIPVALKDEAWTAGIRSTGGSWMFADFVPEHDGAVAERLRAAGTVLIGKNTMPEYASFPRSISPIALESVNPWDTTRTSGASSGGSAACLAAGMAPLAIGSDGGGSIRIPAALCGVVGLYPTPGLVPARGSFSYSPRGSLGPMARDTRDVATLLQCVAGHDPADPTSLSATPPDYLAGIEAGVKGMRIAWSPDYGHITFEDPRLPELVRRTAFALGDAGAEVEEVDFSIPDTWPCLSALSPSAAFTGEPLPFTQTEEFARLLAANAQRISPHLQQRLAAGPITRERYAEGHALELEITRRLTAVLDRYDVLLSPTMSVVAPKVPEGWVTPYAGSDCGTTFTAIANCTRSAAASVPCGLLDGLPAGIQVLGRPLAEALVLRVARALELAAPAIGHPALP